MIYQTHIIVRVFYLIILSLLFIFSFLRFLYNPLLLFFGGILYIIVIVRGRQLPRPHTIDKIGFIILPLIQILSLNLRNPKPIYIWVHRDKNNGLLGFIISIFLIILSIGCLKFFPRHYILIHFHL